MQTETERTETEMTNAELTNSELMDVAVRNAWVWGFTPQAETWNGRFAMIGFVSALLIEVFSHQGVLHFWGILPSGIVPVV